MGRAITMENDIEDIKIRLADVEKSLNIILEAVDESDEKSTKVKHVDLVEDVNKEEKPSGKTKTKKANNETSKNSNRKPNKRRSTTDAKGV